MRFTSTFPPLFQVTEDGYLYFSILLEQIQAVDNAEANNNDAVDILDARKITPLHTAVKYSGEASVLLLLEYGADPNAVTQKGETPLLRIRDAIQCCRDLPRH